MKIILVFRKHIKWKISICLISISSVYYISSISIEDSPLTIFNSKTLRKSLTKAKKEFALKFCTYLDIVITKNKITIISWKQNSSILLSYYFKVEGVFCISKFISCLFDDKTWRSLRILRKWIWCWNLKPFLFTIYDFKVKIIVSMREEDEL